MKKFTFFFTFFRTGEELEIIEYDRLSPLEMGKQLHSKKWIEQLKSGDCVVAFSRREILRLKKEIERYWEGKRYCGVVYGSLPPPSRVSQAEMFNESGFFFFFVCLFVCLVLILGFCLLL